MAFPFAFAVPVVVAAIVAVAGIGGAVALHDHMEQDNASETGPVHPVLDPGGPPEPQYVNPLEEEYPVISEQPTVPEEVFVPEEGEGMTVITIPVPTVEYPPTYPDVYVYPYPVVDEVPPEPLEPDFDVPVEPSAGFEYWVIEGNMNASVLVAVFVMALLSFFVTKVWVENRGSRKW